MRSIPQSITLLYACLGFLGCLVAQPALAQTNFAVKTVVLSKTTKHRNPSGIFSPPAHCEKNSNGHDHLTVIDSAQTSQIVFWVKVLAKTAGEIRHNWYHQQNGMWTKVSEVNLPIQPSFGYRMWSLVPLLPIRDTGEWMIVVAPSSKPDQVLCIARFMVK